MASQSGFKTPPRASTSASASAIQYSRVSSIQAEEGIHSSVNSTPNRPHSTGTSEFKKTMDPQLRQDMQDRFLQVSLKTYISGILEVGDEEFKQRKNKDWQSLKLELQNEIERYTSVTHEKHMYEPFIAIANKVIEKSSEIMGEPLDYPYNLQYHDQSGETPDSRTDSENDLKRRLKPDVVLFYAGDIDEGTSAQSEATTSGRKPTGGRQSSPPQPGLNTDNSAINTNPPVEGIREEDEGYTSDLGPPTNSAWDKIFLPIEFKRKWKSSKLAGGNSSKEASDSKRSSSAQRGLGTQSQRGRNPSRQTSAAEKQASQSQGMFLFDRTYIMFMIEAVVSIQP